ncbi:MAG: hypothetical protein QOI76_4258 [Frankiales bacterium]|nr:hypothetical protein [Frankiales bacterium]
MAGSALLVAVDIEVELSDAVVVAGPDAGLATVDADTAADGAKGGDPEAEDAPLVHPVPRANIRHTAISRRAVTQAWTPQAPPWLSYADRNSLSPGRMSETGIAEPGSSAG